MSPYPYKESELINSLRAKIAALESSLRDRDERVKEFAKQVFDAFIYQSSERLSKKPAQVGGPLSGASYEEAEESRESMARWESNRLDAERRIDPIIKAAREMYRLSSSPAPAAKEAKPCDHVYPYPNGAGVCPDCARAAALAPQGQEERK